MPSDRLLTLLVSAMKYHPIPLVGNICRSPSDSHCEGEKQSNSLQLSPNCAWFAGYIPVSYTHLDVYKRQDLAGAGAFGGPVLRDDLGRL